MEYFSAFFDDLSITDVAQGFFRVNAIGAAGGTLTSRGLKVKHRPLYQVLRVFK
jgi:hypothetical protein